jgi:DNA-binding IclR family transcriptional regulator
MKHHDESCAPSVTRALDLLETLGRSAQGMTLSELSRKLEIPKSTTHYLIHTLTARGYLQRLPWTRQYSLGVRAFDFTSKTGGDLWMRQILSPRIRALAQRVAMGVQIAVLKGGEGMVVDRVDGRPFPSSTLPGHHFRLHCTAAGKVLIAWLPEDELERLFPLRYLGRFTPKTITHFEKLKEHLAEVRKKRYAVNDEEYHLDRRAVAVPIFNSAAKVVAALSVDGSSVEIQIPRLPNLADVLLETGRDISREICAN